MFKQNKTEEEEEEEFGYVLYAMFKYMGLIVVGMWLFVLITTYGNVCCAESVNWLEVMYVGMFGFDEKWVPLLALGKLVVMIGFVVYGHLGMLKMEKEWRESD